MADAAAPLRSLTINDVAVGDHVERTAVVSQADIDAFARLSGDFNPIHVDPEFAATTSFGRTLAHGPILSAHAAGLVGTQLPGVGAIGISSHIAHLAPVYAGDTVHTRVEVAAVDRDRRRLELAFTWRNQDGDLVGEGGAVVRPTRVAVAL